jgi:hypothetical protein
MEIKDFGFIVLSPYHNIGGLKGTVRSIFNNYSSSTNVICVTEKAIKSPQFKEMNDLCKTYRGSNTITSLINKGLEKSNSDWNILVMEGSWVKKDLPSKYLRWIKSQKDVLYSIVINYDKQGMPKQIFKDFENCSLNGICINKNFFKEVGNFSDNPLDISRLFWAFEAADKGATFKGILGIKII